ncbi:MAG: ShlB/FhaC/HecB family hemolysin secretion/activation protein [Pseudomonadota bacterium]
MLVIIAAGIFTAFSAICASAERPLLTTVAVPAPAAKAAVPTLTTVIVAGSTIYSTPRLFAAYRDQLGLDINRDNARAIVDALTALYVRDGYVKPEISLDDSMTGRGVLRAQVYEAQVTRVVYEGDDGAFLPALKRIGQELEGARPLRKDDVPQALRRMREIAGLAVTASTRRDAETRNAFELVVDSDYSAIDGVLRMNNRGTDQVGPLFLLGQVFANGLFGHQEKIGLIFAAATDHEEYLGGGLYLDTPLGDRGTRANALVFSSHSAPNEAPVNLDDEYTRERATFKLSQPLRQDAAFSLTGSVGLEADDLTINRAGTAIREDRLRIIETALRGGFRAGAIQYSAGLQLRKGLNGLGGGLQAADLAEDPRRADFLLTQLTASAYRRFADRWSLRLDLLAQHTGYVLPDSERFKIGGDRLGRGFEVAEIAGDRGLGGKIELRRDLLNTETLIGRLSTYGFYDIGSAWKQDRPGRESAATTGVGFAMQGAKLTGYLELAAPISGPDIEGQRHASVFGELSYRF